ncbi:hypothetical protein C8N43_2226 [Litoreibacter ponti]|uniref:Uncharacterized protein n=1 Tax=Litoreibacter ponti TaxID=1510457 RepID=A0A2T6BNC1_9RHOB|nr:hypothetical protein [Litoreibacter ponti]PTX57556.1 hypothetical protein C8N43_2226 [Litoreibacter ponti]
MPEPQSSSATPVSPEQVKKARMLVSMLGADFAKSSKHPFFKDLARTAVQPSPEPMNAPDMSAALAKLVKTLADPRVAQRLRPKPSPEPEARPEVTAPLPLDTDLPMQHPVLIAKQMMGFPKPDRVAMMRRLPGPTARQVAAYLSELEADTAE